MKYLPHCAMMIAAVLVVGCKPAPAPTSAQTSSAAAPAAPVAAATAQAEQGKQEMGSLQGLLDLLGAKDGAAWSAFDRAAGVQWRDPAPQDNPDSNAPENARYRSGTLLLSGFGAVEVPDGKAGAEAGTRQANEGEVGVTLNGDAERVHSFSLVKFYASDDYQGILRNQLGPGTSLKPIAGQCELDYGTTSENTQANQFFELGLTGSKIVYAEVYVDDGGNQGPGTTTFEFTHDKPARKIASMRCKEF
ncbi:hypothetical protein [Lysobacter sp. CA199]|uniref:hypothetical protein n=1 Tax=Lysobacter sp. CA199 TaxID=3455608 RepID=UPI003F8D6985